MYVADKRALIYGLIDLRTREIRYIGYSTNGLTRPNSHRGKWNLELGSLKSTWLKELFASGSDYEPTILEVVDNPTASALPLCWWDAHRNRTALKDAEVWWIAFGKACGWGLTNSTAGGDGLIGAHANTREKLSKSKKGKPLTAEHRISIGVGVKASPAYRVACAAMRGRKASAETKAKISAAGIGRKHSQETLMKLNGRKCSSATRLKMSAAQTGRTHNEATRQKISANNRGRKVSQETRMRQSISLKGKKRSMSTRKNMSVAAIKRMQQPGVLDKFLRQNPSKDPEKARLRGFAKSRNAARKLGCTHDNFPACGCPSRSPDKRSKSTR